MEGLSPPLDLEVISRIQITTGGSTSSS